MAGRECYHCKRWIKEGQEHDCRTTTEAALMRDLQEELRDAWERVCETAVSFCDQRIYASHKSIIEATRRESAGHLILRRPLRVVDHEHLDGSLLRFQFQPKLLAQSGEKRRPVRNGWRFIWRGSGKSQSSFCGVLQLRRPLQREILVSIKAGLINHGN